MSERHRRLPRGQRKPRDPVTTRQRNANDQREISGLIGDLGDAVNAAGLSMHVSAKKRHINSRHSTYKPPQR